MDKYQLSERDICTKFIVPAIERAGWLQLQFREEVSLTDGRVMVRGKLAARIKNPDAKDGPSSPLPVPPATVLPQIIASLRRHQRGCEEMEKRPGAKQDVTERFITAAIADVIGIAAEQVAYSLLPDETEECI